MVAVGLWWERQVMPPTTTPPNSNMCTFEIQMLFLGHHRRALPSRGSDEVPETSYDRIQELRGASPGTLMTALAFASTLLDCLAVYKPRSPHMGLAQRGRTEATTRIRLHRRSRTAAAGIRAARTRTDRERRNFRSQC